jgi:uncharacterized protein YkwD
MPGPFAIALGRRVAAAAASLLAISAILVAPAGAHSRGHGRSAHHSRSCPNADVSAAGAPLAVVRSAVVCLINQQRAAHGLPALRANRRLNRSSQGWSDRMVASSIFGHGADFSARISAAGFVWQAAGENIATGFATPQAVVSAWMGSLDHCQNILDPAYKDVGTGVNASPVQGFGSGGATWTQDFALPMHAKAPSHSWAPARSCPY